MPQPPGSPTAPEPERGSIRRLFGRAVGRRPSPDPTAVRAVPPHAGIHGSYEPSIDGERPRHIDDDEAHEVESSSHDSTVLGLSA